jgi:DNA-3-methyladenine glycosylase II
VLFHPILPYDFARTMQASLNLFVMGALHDGTYRRVLRVGEALALIEVENRGTVDAPLIESRILKSVGELDEAALWVKARRVLNVDSDLKPFYALAQGDVVLAETIQKLYGLHSLQADSLFEALALTMIEQQIALKMAQAAERWLLAWGGEIIEYEGEMYYAFPRPERIAAATVNDLTPLKITFGRMQRLIDLARAAETLEALRDQPAEIAYEALVGYKGVGHWTAAWTLIRAQGRFAYVGVNDVALRAAVNAYYFGQNGRADAAVVDQTFARYEAYSGIAAFYTIMRWADREKKD